MTREEIKHKFDKVVSECADLNTAQYGDVNFWTGIYIKLFGEFPHMMALSSDGFYMNPKAGDAIDEDEDDEDTYNEEEPESLFTFDNISITKTFISLTELFGDSAYVIRRDTYPAIIADNFIAFWFDYKYELIVLQNSPELREDVKNAVIDKKNDEQHRWYSYITSTAQGFNETGMIVKKQDIDINMNYNDDLPHDQIIEFLKSSQSGLILLHGAAGTGKTSYIRNLMYELKGRRFMVLDASVFSYITDASFISLLLENKNCVVILEDCETMLADRLTTNNQLLSTLLNISDGIIGDSFNFKFICTFNANITKLDKAIQRKGRMKIKYEFKELAADKAYALGKKLGKDIPEDTKPLTLADIFNYGEDNGSTPDKSTKIGFAK